jgi:hypothetical protein
MCRRERSTAQKFYKDRAQASHEQLADRFFPPPHREASP